MRISKAVVGANWLRMVCRVELKELKIRPNTDVHDYQVRLRSAAKFISKVRNYIWRTHCTRVAHAVTGQPRGS